MFSTIVAFELRYQLRRPVTWLFFLVFFLIAFFAIASDAVLSAGATGQIKRNAPFILASIAAIITALGQIITTSIAGTAVLRDAQMGSQELLFTTRLTKPGYLFGRFVGSFGVMLVIYTALPLGLLLGSIMPWVPADKLGPLSIEAIVRPFVIIVIPNLLFISALFFAVGALTRKLFAVYVQGIALLTVWQITQTIIGSLDKVQLGSLVDPFGITTIGVTTRYWSVVEKNTRQLPLDATMLSNRLLWIAIAFALFGIVYATFRLRLAGGRPGKVNAKAALQRGPDTIPAVAFSFDRASRWRMLRSLTRFNFLAIVKEAPFRAIAVIGGINLMVGLWYASRPNDSVTWPVTATLAPYVLRAQQLIFIILITLYCGELVWRERQLRSDQINDALPVPIGVTLAGKMMGLWLAMVVVLGLSVLAAMGMQLVQGYTHLQPLLYLQIAMTGIPVLFILIFLAFAVHTLVDQKFIGHVALILFYIGTQIASTLGFDHRLYQYGRAPDFTYSDMNGFGPYIPRMLLLDGFQLGIGLMLVILAYLFWIRGTTPTWTERRRLAARRFTGGARLALGGATGMAALFGGAVFYNTNILNDYTEVRAAEKSSANAERTYKKYEPMAQPRIVGVSVAVDFFPERRAAAFRGTLAAVNRRDVAIDTVYLRLPPIAARPVNQYEASAGTGLTFDTLDLGRPATVLVDDVKQGVRLVRLATPLAPGDSLQLRFAGRFEPKGFPNDAFNNDVAANGSFMNLGVMPGFGYSAQNELADDDVRKKQGLKPKPRMLPIDDPKARENNYISTDADWITFDATVSTAADQIAVAPGYLEKEWTSNGRRYFHYAMDKPVLGFYAFQSARYAVKKVMHNGVSIEIYYYPEHTFALETMLKASEDGLDYFGTHFSPYQFRQYRILEFPRYQGFAQAFPNTIPFSEAIGFLYKIEDRDDAIDFAYFVTAHELAHQWWAHQVVGGFAQGATAFSEGLAEYSALTIMEKRFGPEATQKFLRRELDTYLRGRGSERKKEVPYLFVENQAYIHYYKGSLVYYALRDYIGEEKMNQALASFLQKWAFKGPPYPTARDMFAEFKAVTPDSLQYVLHDLFETITLYENKAESATATKRADGKYVVSLDLRSRKLRADSLGTEAEVPMADYVDVGIFGEKQKGNKLGKRLMVTKVHITANQTNLEYVVDEQPRKAGIDPYNKLIDRTPEDNVIDVTGP